MNFYNWHIGDYATATRHLSWDEDLAYRRLIDAYYVREAPLPTDKRQIYRLVMASSKPQREAVDTVLAEFFKASADGFWHHRCEQELAAYRTKTGKARASAEARWGKAKAAETDQQSQSEGNANASSDAMRTHSEGNAPTTHYPLPSKDLSATHPAREGSPQVTLDAQLREAAGWQSDPSPNLFVTGPIEAAIQAGAILETDVLPVIRSIAHRCRGRPNWNFFVPAIIDARDARLSALTAVSPAKPNGAAHHEQARKRGRSAIEIIGDIADRVAREDGQGSEASGATQAGDRGDATPAPGVGAQGHRGR